MFDFLRKKLNKTIKDASDTIPEDELEEQEEIEETEKQEENKGHFGFLHRNKDKEDESDEEIEETDEETEETITETTTSATEDAEKIEETTTETVTKTTTSTTEDTEKIEETTTETVTETKEEEEPEKENKSRWGFLHRNKNKDKDKEEEEEQEEIEETETITETTTSATEDDEETEETTTETITETKEEEEPEKENKSRWGFLHRNKDKDEDKKEEQEEIEEVKEESEEEEESEVKYKGEEEQGGTFSFITKKTIKEEDIEDILEELEMSLIEGDVAFDVADRIVSSVKEDLIGRKIKRRGDMELFTTNALKKAISEIIDNGSYDLLGDIEASKQKGEPYKIMFVGINGTGKTTTIAKMAKYLEKHGYSSVFGASDTFRAGAIEQLEHHANNLNLKIIKHERNSDPAAVAYDAVEHARATGKDVVLIDTSGRMQTNTNLMDEMKKIKRVAEPDIVIYVGDALMGNDATEQATKFNEVIDIDGIILTKADADAKGGAAISIGHVIHKPILFIGTGQSYDDLMEFEPDWMINQIFNGESEVEA